MIITIFGATGQVGKQLVKQSLFNGHTVRAYGRNVLDLIADEERHENLELIKGGLFDKADVEKAIAGANWIFSALGGGYDGSDQTRSLGMKNIIDAMTKQQVQRIIGIGGMGCLQADADTLICETEHFPDQYKAVTAEHLKALDYLNTSSLDWTFVCPPMIVDADITGQYKAQKDYPVVGNTITTGDLAFFMLKEANENTYLHTKVGIAN
jgi:uncharacterized protein